MATGQDFFPEDGDATTEFSMTQDLSSIIDLNLTEREGSNREVPSLKSISEVSINEDMSSIIDLNLTETRYSNQTFDCTPNTQHLNSTVAVDDLHLSNPVNSASTKADKQIKPPSTDNLERSTDEDSSLKVTASSATIDETKLDQSANLHCHDRTFDKNMVISISSDEEVIDLTDVTHSALENSNTNVACGGTPKPNLSSPEIHKCEEPQHTSNSRFVLPVSPTEMKKFVEFFGEAINTSSDLEEGSFNESNEKVVVLEESVAVKSDSNKTENGESVRPEKEVDALVQPNLNETVILEKAKPEQLEAAAAIVIQPNLNETVILEKAEPEVPGQGSIEEPQLNTTVVVEKTEDVILEDEKLVAVQRNLNETVILERAESESIKAPEQCVSEGHTMNTTVVVQRSQDLFLDEITGEFVARSVTPSAEKRKPQLDISSDKDPEENEAPEENCNLEEDSSGPKLNFQRPARDVSEARRKSQQLKETESLAKVNDWKTAEAPNTAGGVHEAISRLSASGKAPCSPSLALADAFEKLRINSTADETFDSLLVETNSTDSNSLDMSLDVEGGNEKVDAEAADVTAHGFRTPTSEADVPTFESDAMDVSMATVCPTEQKDGETEHKTSISVGDVSTSINEATVEESPQQEVTSTDSAVKSRQSILSWNMPTDAVADEDNVKVGEKAVEGNGVVADVENAIEEVHQALARPVEDVAAPVAVQKSLQDVTDPAVESLQSTAVTLSSIIPMIIVESDSVPKQDNTTVVNTVAGEDGLKVEEENTFQAESGENSTGAATNVENSIQTVELVPLEDIATSLIAMDDADTLNNDASDGPHHAAKSRKSVGITLSSMPFETTPVPVRQQMDRLDNQLYGEILAASPSGADEKFSKYQGYLNLKFERNYLQQEIAKLTLELKRKEAEIIKLYPQKVKTLPRVECDLTSEEPASGIIVSQTPDLQEKKALQEQVDTLQEQLDNLEREHENMKEENVKLKKLLERADVEFSGYVILFEKKLEEEKARTAQVEAKLRSMTEKYEFSKEIFVETKAAWEKTEAKWVAEKKEITEKFELFKKSSLERIAEANKENERIKSEAAKEAEKVRNEGARAVQKRGLSRKN